MACLLIDKGGHNQVRLCWLRPRHCHWGKQTKWNYQSYYKNFINISHVVHYNCNCISVGSGNEIQQNPVHSNKKVHFYRDNFMVQTGSKQYQEYQLLVSRRTQTLSTANTAHVCIHTVFAISHATECGRSRKCAHNLLTDSKHQNLNTKSERKSLVR